MVDSGFSRRSLILPREALRTSMEAVVVGLALSGLLELGGAAMSLPIGCRTHSSGPHSSMDTASLTRLSPLSLLSGVAFSRGVVVAACTCVCVVFLEYFPAKPGASRAHWDVAVVEVHLGVAGDLSHLLLALSSTMVLLLMLLSDGPLSLVSYLIVSGWEVGAHRVTTKCVRGLPASTCTNTVDHLDLLLDLLVAVHLLRAAVVAETAAQDLLRKNDVLTIQLGRLLP